MAKPHDPIKLAKAREYSKTGRGKLIRELADLSMGELARWCGSSQPTISGWERGLHDPTGDAAVKWAEVLAKLEAPQRRRRLNRGTAATTPPRAPGAEEVKPAARVCRFCGHRFEGPMSAPATPADEEVPAENHAARESPAPIAEPSQAPSCGESRSGRETG